MLGPPGAGKGTQAKLISEKLGVPHISTGEIFRKEMSAGTDLGKKVTDIMNSGKLVDDETTLEIFKKRLSQPDCADGAILDGIPRTLNQAHLLDKLFTDLKINLDYVVSIVLLETEIVNRLTGRRTCKQCGRSYHIVYDPPITHNICDLDGAPLFQREDQKMEAVQERIKVYKTQTEPLIKYYKDLDLLIEIDGQQEIEQVTAEIFEKLDL